MAKLPHLASGSLLLLLKTNLLLLIPFQSSDVAVAFVGTPVSPLSIVPRLSPGYIFYLGPRFVSKWFDSYVLLMNVTPKPYPPYTFVVRLSSQSLSLHLYSRNNLPLPLLSQLDLNPKNYGQLPPHPLLKPLSQIYTDLPPLHYLCPLYHLA